MRRKVVLGASAGDDVRVCLTTIVCVCVGLSNECWEEVMAVLYVQSCSSNIGHCYWFGPGSFYGKEFERSACH